MTEENYNDRTSQTLLYNQFSGFGKWEIPVIPLIPRFESHPGDFGDSLLIGFDKTHLEDQNHLDRMVHLFLYGETRGHGQSDIRNHGVGTSTPPS